MLCPLPNSFSIKRKSTKCFHTVTSLLLSLLFFLHLLRRADAAGDLDAAAIAPGVGLMDMFHSIAHDHAVVVCVFIVVMAGMSSIRGRVTAHAGATHAIDRRHQGAKQKMLHDGQLPQNLGHEHATHAGLDLLPRLGGGDVVEHGTVPSQALDVLDAVDEGHLIEIEIVGRVLFQDQGLVNGAGSDVGVVHQLRGPKEEGQELVIVETPDAVRPGRFEVVCRLDQSHESEIPGEDLEDDGPKVGGSDEFKLVKTESVEKQHGRQSVGAERLQYQKEHSHSHVQPDHKVQFMPRAIVDSRPVAKGLRKVSRHLIHRRFAHDAQFAMPAVIFLAHSI